ncbi:MAG: tetratricopeptide repeat protein [Myxococcaceae bacterium]
MTAVLCLLSGAALAASGSELGRLDELYARRDQPGALGELVQGVGEQLAREGDNYPLLWRAARAHCALAKTTPSGDRQRTVAEVCWTLGDRARAQNPTGAEGHYWAAMGVGLWAQTLGVFKAMSQGVEGKLHERLDRAIELDPGTDRGGPWLIKGRFYHEAPWPLQDLKRAGDYYAKVLGRYPENLRARLYQAMLAADRGDPQKARAELETLLSADTSYDQPEGRAVKVEAAKRLAELKESAR